MLMLSGILIVGVTTATVVSYFNETIRRHVAPPSDHDVDASATDEKETR
jgi:hypothetical protein